MRLFFHWRERSRILVTHCRYRKYQQVAHIVVDSRQPTKRKFEPRRKTVSTWCQKVRRFAFLTLNLEHPKNSGIPKWWNLPSHQHAREAVSFPNCPQHAGPTTLFALTVDVQFQPSKGGIHYARFACQQHSRKVRTNHGKHRHYYYCS